MLDPEALQALAAWAAKEYPRDTGAGSLTVGPSEIVWSTEDYSLAALQEHAHSIAERLEPLLGAEIFVQALLRFLVSLSLEESKAARLLPFPGAGSWHDVSESQWTVNGSFPRGRYAVHSVLHPADGSYVSSIEVVAESVAPQDLNEVVADLDQQGIRFIPEDPLLRSTANLAPLQAVPFLMEEELTTSRAELLARKHGGQAFSDEDELRLDALSRRVRQLLPRVSHKDWERLTEIDARVHETELLVDQVRRKHRLGNHG